MPAACGPGRSARAQAPRAGGARPGRPRGMARLAVISDRTGCRGPPARPRLRSRDLGQVCGTGSWRPSAARPGEGSADSAARRACEWSGGRSCEGGVAGGDRHGFGTAARARGAGGLAGDRTRPARVPVPPPAETGERQGLAVVWTGGLLWKQQTHAQTGWRAARSRRRAPASHEPRRPAGTCCWRVAPCSTSKPALAAPLRRAWHGLHAVRGRELKRASRRRVGLGYW